ncbi:MAG: hypothetical protein EAZ97_13810 [Bacteroidetes bacterium]|nr:MAG: hypothetical protein EAZ97_13810 [Bacteroidota bacterium]
MKNLFFIFLISLLLFSCKENDTPKPFDANSQHYLNAKLDQDSIKESIDQNQLSKFYATFGGSPTYLTYSFLFMPDNQNNYQVLGRKIEINFTYGMKEIIWGDSIENKLSCVERKEYVKVGKYPFGRSGNSNYPYDTPNHGMKDGVELSFNEANIGYGADKVWLSSMLPQPKESYFEITEVIPDAINPDLLHVKARFSCLLGRMRLQQDVIKTFSGEMKGIVICTGK